MLKLIKDIIKSDKFKKIINYGISGVITTVISFVTFKLFLYFLQYLIAFSLSWIIAVTFAYFSTRKSVYESYETSKRGILLEFMRFILGRVFTYVVNFVLLLIAVECFKLDEFYSNAVITVLVIILNYFVGNITINKLKFGRRNAK